MKIHRFASLLTVALFAFSAVAAEKTFNLNKVRGKVYKVNFEERSFEFLTPTKYAPTVPEGKSRHKVYWSETAKFSTVVYHPDFRSVKERTVVSFYNLDEKSTAAIKEGRAFVAKKAGLKVGQTKPSGLRKDGRALSAFFTPKAGDKRKRSGVVEFEGKSIPVSLHRRRPTVRVSEDVTADIFKTGLFEAVLYGAEKDGKFVANRLDVTPLPDPRKLDDPALPRVLVVGDSISMNYHKAAKAALKGKANYYRVEGNGGPSDRGVSNMELWLGDYTQKGLQWDVIMLNHGLHDLKQKFDAETKTWSKHQVEIEDYKKNLEKEIVILKKTGAKLVWTTTTPVPNSSTGTYARRKDEDLVFNKAALEVFSKYPEIQINDLNKVVRESAVFDTWRQGSNVHFKEAEQEVLGKAVAEAVLKALEK